MKKNFMKNSLKWVFAIALAFVLSIAVGKDATVLADSSTTMSFNTTYSKTVTEGNVDKYYMTLPTSGRVTVNLNALEGRAYWKIVDSNYENLIDSSNYSTKDYATNSNRYVIDLKAGTYELDMWTYDELKYTLSIQFVSANETYGYNNDLYIDVASQPAIPFNKKITGQFALNDEIDYYKLVVPATGKVNFSFLNETGRIIFNIRNAQDIAVTNNLWIEKGSLNNSYTLKKGTYYICFDQCSVAGIGAINGKYYFTASYEIDGPTNVTAKASSYKALKVTAKKSGSIAGYQIRYRKGSGSWKTVTVEGNKNLIRTISVTPASYKVQVRTYCVASGNPYYSKWSGTKSATCKISTPTSIKVKNSSSKALKITAKKKGTIKGYQIRYKKGSGSWKNVKVKGNKNLNLTIEKLTKGATYKVQVRAYCEISKKPYYSTWSSTKTVRITK